MCGVLFYLFVVLMIFINVDTRSIRKNPQRNNLFDERNGNYWQIQAQWVLKSKVSQQLNTNVAKNVILFLGDGMSITTLAATRAYLGQKYGHFGEELKLVFEAFPYTGLAKTYCVDSNVADSACSGTAYLAGVKSNTGTVGVTGAVRRGDCMAQLSGNYSVTGLVDWAQQAGKATGVVTTTRVTHATPAASYAHSAERKWESDLETLKSVAVCEDIASQLVRGKVGSNIDVILGGGRKNFLSRTETDEEGFQGHRIDSTNLINEWLTRKKQLGARPRYVFNKKGLTELSLDECDSLLGLFAPDHMPYRLEANRNEDPSLGEMTSRALDILTKKQSGYFLLVEGGRIDTAHHEAKARKALDETAELAKAVELAVQRTNPDDTLILVTSDHSHTLTYSGYSKRGSDILGFANKMNTTDKLPYTILSYANGPGFKLNEGRQRYNLILDDLKSLNYSYPGLTPIFRETHGGEDVAVFAIGPWAHLFTGNYEQNYIPHAIAYAACWGKGLTACNS